MSRTVWPWAIAGLVIILAVAFRRDSYEEHRQLVIEQFHLPAEVEFAAFRSEYNRNTGESIEAIVQFSPEEYHDFVASLHDRAVWTGTSFEFDGKVIDGRPTRGAFRWSEGDRAIIGPAHVVRWVRWGFIHDKEHEGKPGIWDIGRHKSLCFAVAGEGQRIDACTAFGDDEYKSFYVRATLDQEGQRLFVHVQ